MLLYKNLFKDNIRRTVIEEANFDWKTCNIHSALQRLRIVYRCMPKENPGNVQGDKQTGCSLSGVQR